MKRCFGRNWNIKNANKNLRNAIYYLKNLFGKDIFTGNNGNLEINPACRIETDDDPLKGEVLQGFFIKNCP